MNESGGGGGAGTSGSVAAGSTPFQPLMLTAMSAPAGGKLLVSQQAIALQQGLGSWQGTHVDSPVCLHWAFIGHLTLVQAARPSRPLLWLLHRRRGQPARRQRDTPFQTSLARQQR